MTWLKRIIGWPATCILLGGFRGWLTLVLVTAPIGALTLPALNGWLNDRAQERVVRKRDDLPTHTALVRPIGGSTLVVCRDTQGVPFLATLPLPEDTPLSGTIERQLLSRYSVRTEKPMSAGTEYRPDLLLIEIVQETNDHGEWRVTADLGIQQRPGQWVRIRWWTKDGIAPSNELMRVECSRNLLIPLYKISTPTTFEALLAYLRENWTTTAKKINPDYGKEPLAVKPKDFENDAVGPLASVVPSDWSWLLILGDVFLLNTVGGALQYLMLFTFEMGIVLLAIRYLSLVVCRRIDVDSAKGRYMASELGSTIIWAGLIGTVLYLSLAVLRLRISPSPAVMSSIIASMAGMMGQAFLTKLVSSTLQRILAWLEATTLAAEDAAASHPHVKSNSDCQSMPASKPTGSSDPEPAISAVPAPIASATSGTASLATGDPIVVFSQVALPVGGFAVAGVSEISVECTDADNVLVGTTDGNCPATPRSAIGSAS